MEKDEILLIEDEPGWQRELQRILKQAGYEVRIVDNYPDAVAALNERTAKVAVIDVSLVRGKGDDRQGIKIMEEARIPVVCVSGYLGTEDPDEVGELLQEGLADWFFGKKTFNEEKFLEAVGRSLVKSKAEISKRWRIIERRLRPGD